MSPVDKDNRVKPIASFDAEVVVLGERRYGDSERDPLGGLAPLDLAVGWGIMGRKSIREEVGVSQSTRRYYWRVRGGDLPQEDIETIGVSSANWHIIPANSSVKKKLMALDEEDHVRLKGWLVEAKLKRGEPGRSSLTRTDTGDGACEIIWVNEVIMK